MISLKELLGQNDFENQSQDVKDNLNTLLSRVNEIRLKWNRPMTVTSGLRTKEDQIRVYKQKAEKAGVPFDESKVPMGSQHLKGAAVDIYDPGLELTAWLKSNPEVLESAQLWCEEGNANWVHFQLVSPPSGHRWFYP